MRQLIVILVLLLAGCISVPDHIRPVNNFKAERYLGTWYEIARLDHSFERDLTHITAEYSLRDDGGINVVNRGYSASEQKWQQAEGKAYFVGEPHQGHLKVSFFEPIYASYIVFELDHANYQYALITGPDKSYFWLLAREPKINDTLKKVLITKAASLGFDTSQLIFVDQTPLKAN